MTGDVPPEASVRAFMALPFAEADVARLADLIESLRPGTAAVRWTRRDALHLTLRFLGASSPRALDSIGARLRRETAGVAPASVRPSGLGLFPERGKARVLWLGLDLPRALLDLQRACEEAARDAGFAPEPRAFVPHVTLGRWRSPARRPDLPAVDLGAMPVDRVVVFRSDPGRDGAVYTPLQVHALGGS